MLNDMNSTELFANIINNGLKCTKEMPSGKQLWQNIR